MVYNEWINLKEAANRRMFISELQHDGSRFFVENPTPLLFYKNENKNRREKNWSPFEYNGDLLLIYSIHPHLIFRPLDGTNTCETFASTKGAIEWNWGELRGGSPALLIGDEYLSFFHSCKSMPTAHSNGKQIDHYFMGAYTFSAQPPFNVTRISPEPIVGKDFYHGPLHNTWKPLHVVFPGGFIFDNDYAWVFYGRQDHEIWAAKLFIKGLLESLIPVTTIE